MPVNAITVDLEDYYHAANLAAATPRRNWSKLESRVEYSTRLTLESFERHNIKATFFVLGYCAKRNPKLIKDIADAGHEIASHGYSHHLAYAQTPKQFLRDVRVARELLQQLTGENVEGYRAPNFSITDRNTWAYELLIQAGYRYDSSLYPVWHPRYANLAKPLEPHKITCPSGELFCFPLAVAGSYELLGNLGKLPGLNKFRLGVAGGAYWRIFPKFINKLLLSRINASGRWFTCYFHPWELDAGQPYFSFLPNLTRFRHYRGIADFPQTLEYFFKNFEFASLRTASKQSLEVSQSFSITQASK